jgi:hypothetical protein
LVFFFFLYTDRVPEELSESGHGMQFQLVVSDSYTSSSVRVIWQSLRKSIFLS